MNKAASMLDPHLIPPGPNCYRQVALQPGELLEPFAPERFGKTSGDAQRQAPLGLHKRVLCPYWQATSQGTCRCDFWSVQSSDALDDEIKICGIKPVDLQLGAYPHLSLRDANLPPAFLSAIQQANWPASDFCYIQGMVWEVSDLLGNTWGYLHTAYGPTLPADELTPSPHSLRELCVTHMEPELPPAQMQATRQELARRFG